MKILVVRFSSIGDVVLTTPIVRCLKEQLSEVQVHFITKKSFESILKDNPNIDKLYTINSSIGEVLPDLKKEKYDYVIDLHKNLRTSSLKLKLGVKSYSFPKLNFKKWLLVQLKKNNMPKVHIVERYFKTVKKLGVVNDELNCEFFINRKDEVNTMESIGFSPGTYVCFAIGAQFYTKRLPIAKMKELIEQLEVPIALVGGPTDSEIGTELVKSFPSKKIVNTCGDFSLPQSASIVKQAQLLISHDTGLMHIASCFNVPIVSIWGNTVPALGMYPYYPKGKTNFSIHEVENLDCRPCSKIGFKACPKGHFKCMNNQDVFKISKEIKDRIKS